MKYDYYCDKGCTLKDYAKSKADGHTITIRKDYEVMGDEPLIWEESHGMDELPAIKCPVCNGPALKSLTFSSANWHIKGNWALDKAGCRREMHIHKLNTPSENPYDQHYEPGEREDIKHRLMKAGRKAMRHKQVEMIPAVEKKMAKKKKTIIRLG